MTIHGVVKSYTKYELLENVDGAARVAWVHWNRFLQPQLGAVYIDKMLVARHEAPKDKKSRYTYYIGTLRAIDNHFFGSIVYVNEVSTEISRALSNLPNWKREKCIATLPFVSDLAKVQTDRLQQVKLWKRE